LKEQEDNLSRSQLTDNLQLPPWPESYDSWPKTSPSFGKTPFLAVAIYSESTIASVAEIVFRTIYSRRKPSFLAAIIDSQSFVRLQTETPSSLAVAIHSELTIAFRGRNRTIHRPKTYLSRSCNRQPTYDCIPWPELYDSWPKNPPLRLQLTANIQLLLWLESSFARFTAENPFSRSRSTVNLRLPSVAGIVFRMIYGRKITFLSQLQSTANLRLPPVAEIAFRTIYG
jgi:hypothetical protein